MGARVGPALPASPHAEPAGNGPRRTPLRNHLSDGPHWHLKLYHRCPPGIRHSRCSCTNCSPPHSGPRKKDEHPHHQPTESASQGSQPRSWGNGGRAATTAHPGAPRALRLSAAAQGLPGHLQRHAPSSLRRPCGNPSLPQFTLLLIYSWVYLTLSNAPRRPWVPTREVTHTRSSPVPGQRVPRGDRGATPCPTPWLLRVGPRAQAGL